MKKAAAILFLFTAFIFSQLVADYLFPRTSLFYEPEVSGETKDDFVIGSKYKMVLTGETVLYVASKPWGDSSGGSMLVKWVDDDGVVREEWVWPSELIWKDCQ